MGGESYLIVGSTDGRLGYYHVEENGILSFIEFVLLPVQTLRGQQAKFVVERRDDSPLEYSSIDQIHEDYRNDIVRFGIRFLVL